nr:tripartite tricarboxylate transporter TctB family protein [Roseospira visakhapatnamensis]
MAGLGLIVATRDLPGVGQHPVGPDLAPWLIGLAMMGAGALLVARPPAAPEDGGPDPSSPGLEGGTGPVLLMLAGALAWAVLLAPLGFLVVTPPLLAGLLWMCTGRPGRAVGLAVLVTGVLHVLVAGLLGVPLPWGLLAPLAPALMPALVGVPTGAPAWT